MAPVWHQYEGNMKKKVLITGITGQDGSYLAELLLEKNYEVHGIVRRASLENTRNFWRINHIKDDLQIHPCSIDSFPSLFNLLKKISPDECYHFAAQSFVSNSFEDEFNTMNTNVNGTHFLLSSIHSICPECKFYFSGSSEMFGSVNIEPQNETTSFKPRSIYGISKVVGYELTRNYRENNKMFACTGILYNHESPRRSLEFVTRKITHTACQIKLGLAKELRLGNLEARRDWGHSKDYVKAMYKILNHDVPEDFVIGTGKTHTVREFLKIAFAELNLNYNDFVIIDKQFFRFDENKVLRADSTKAYKKLIWKPEMKFENLVVEMVRSDYNSLKKLKGC